MKGKVWMLAQKSISKLIGVHIEYRGYDYGLADIGSSASTSVLFVLSSIVEMTRIRICLEVGLVY